MNIPASSPCCPVMENRKSVFKETAIPEMETINIYPLECTHAPQGANTFIGGRYFDQALRDSEIVKSRTKPAEHRRQLRRLQENSNRVLKKAKKINISWSLDANDTDAVLA